MSISNARPACSICLDVGNTHVHVGIKTANATDWDQLLRFDADQRRTAEEWNCFLAPYFVPVVKPGCRVGMASVVPRISSTLLEYFRRYVQTDPVIVSARDDLGIFVATDQPDETGQDRIANAVAAFSATAGAVVIVDMGTATKVDAIDADGRFLGGAIAPGLGLSLEALASRAARLYSVPLQVPQNVVGSNTTSAIQSGILFGHLSLVTGLVEQVKREMGGNVPVLVTGGYANLIIDELPESFIHRPNLTLDGVDIVTNRDF